MLICISRDHAGKPGKEDRGATYGGFVETDLTQAYILELEKLLRLAGHEVILLFDGSYRERWFRANSYRSDLYLSCHVNAGCHHYGAFFWKARCSASRRFADCIRDECSKQNLLTDFRSLQADHDFRRVRNCIHGVEGPAVLLEPFFIDNPAHAYLRSLPGLQDLAYAISCGVCHAEGKR